MAAVPQDLLDRIRMLEQQVRELSGRANMRPALNIVRGGPVSVGEGGYFAAYAPNGTAVFGTGHWTGSGRYGLAIRRESGAMAIDSGSDGSADGMIRVLSRSGSVIVMDDAYADGYLGRPSIPIPWQPTSSSSTSSSTMTSAWLAAQRVQCPVWYLHTESYAPPGATVRVEVQALQGGQWSTWDTWTVTGGAAGQWSERHITRPMTAPHMTHVTWRIRHQVASGTGQVITNVYGSYQRNTFSADEAPPNAAIAAAPAAMADGSPADGDGDGDDQALDTEPPAPAPRPGLHRIND
ncbi:hypothetical protein N0X72_25300 [Streptomyces carpaticus]|uniref:hypothetical protein n=1 Tax=Streptomyces carpaticus TaxID=285558 RepID=UPI00220EEB42|nr:hypothetical protein N0X72_25300 [Streptomyces carpaticus]